MIFPLALSTTYFKTLGSFLFATVGASSPDQAQHRSEVGEPRRLRLSIRGFPNGQIVASEIPTSRSDAEIWVRPQPIEHLAGRVRVLRHCPPHEWRLVLCECSKERGW